MKFENTEVWGFKHAIRGMRNPKNSWSKSDSIFETSTDFTLGAKDIKLAQTLIKGGSEHRKFLRQIFVSVDITAPLYWYKEFDTYKTGTTANSTSTMHTILNYPITIDSFETDDMSLPVDPEFLNIIDYCERLRLRIKEKIQNKDSDEDIKAAWKLLIRVLPESWVQTRTITLNYENIYSMIRQRKNHKLNEWSGLTNDNLVNFISWTKTLPYAKELLFLGEEELWDRNKTLVVKDNSVTSRALESIHAFIDKEAAVITTEYKTKESSSDTDVVNHPPHYTSGGIECIDAMIAAYGTDVVKDFCLCNNFKYMWRFNKKNGAEDLDKATWYMNKYKELSGK